MGLFASRNSRTARSSATSTPLSLRRLFGGSRRLEAQARKATAGVHGGDPAGDGLPQLQGAAVGQCLPDDRDQAQDFVRIPALVGPHQLLVERGQLLEGGENGLLRTVRDAGCLDQVLNGGQLRLQV